MRQLTPQNIALLCLTPSTASITPIHTAADSPEWQCLPCQVLNLRTNVKNRANSADKGVGLNKRKIIEKAVVDELCAMLDSGADEKKLELKKGQPNVVMFVGLQGSGKTTTCSKYGSFFKKKHFKPALVCADTFRAGDSKFLSKYHIAAN